MEALRFGGGFEVTAVHDGNFEHIKISAIIAESFKMLAVDCSWSGHLAELMAYGGGWTTANIRHPSRSQCNHGFKIVVMIKL